VTCLDDATVLGLVEGRLAPELIARVDEHIDSCASCRDVVTHVASSRSQGRVLARGDTVDRYVIGDLLGAGAMGRVYSAWEPELDRRVAIKVLHEEGGRDRLIKEAQAMARLNHPNVVTVHEVGSTDAGVFVAMELVDGETLRAWAAQPREWRDVVRVLVEVARGLAAVHAAGVVHRDIKPDNVIVGADGRIRLGDFGLARSGGSSGAAPSPASFAPLRAGAPPCHGSERSGLQAGAPPCHGSDWSGLRPGALGTVSGGTAVAGTPAYMAPEVLRGGPADAASDQFSFGVLAYELLGGKRPFAGATWADLLHAIETHEVRRVPDVPAWLDDIVQRCIAVEPARRHPSMLVVAELLLERSVRRRPTVWIAAALGAAVLASGVTWKLRDRSSIEYTDWNPPAPAELQRRGLTPQALDTIDRWVTAWNAERRDANRVANPSRSACLMQRRDELSALLVHAPDAPDRLLDAVATLPPPSECKSASADPLPLDRAHADIARSVLDQLPLVRAAVALGNEPARVDAVHQLGTLVARAQASQHEPTIAEVLLVQAEALRLANDALAPIAARDAVLAAERGHADLLRAQAWLTRVAIAGDQRDLAGAEDLGAMAHATIDRVRSPHLAASLARLRGLIAYNRGRLVDARTFLLGARTQFVALGGERTLDIAAVDSALGSVARAAGDLDEAEARHRAVLALDRELRGARHRDIARDLHNIAGVLRLRGKLDDALATYREALAVEIATQGERSVAAALTHNSIGLVELARNDLAAAQRDFALAHDIFTAANHGDRAFTDHNLGLVAQAEGRHGRALAHFDAAARTYTATIGSDAVAPMRLELDRARSEAALGDRAAARKHATSARDRAKVADIGWLADDAIAFLADNPAPVRLPAEPVTIKPALPPPPKPERANPQPRKDVGVYGSAQSPANPVVVAAAAASEAARPRTCNCSKPRAFAADDETRGDRIV
jgi:serine/threonine protein kinase/tetratricopeptide (TPR) repeat protein